MASSPSASSSSSGSSGSSPRSSRSPGRPPTRRGSGRAGSGQRRTGRRANGAAAPRRPSPFRRAPARPTRATAEADRRRHWRPRGLTGRAVLLGALVCALVLLLAIPVSEYLEQRREIAELRQDIEDKKASVAALTEQKLRWEDPAYVEQQARGRLNYVMPGDTVYIVAGPDDSGVPAPPPPPPAADSAAVPEAWYDGLRESIEDVDNG